MNVEGTSFAICSIYSALVFQTEYEGQNYILCAGTWYQVETSFFNQVNNFIRTRVTISDIVLPNCPKDKHEGDYNEQVASADANSCSHRPNISSVISGYKQPSKSAQSIEITGFIEKSRPPEIIFFYTLLPLTA